MKTYQVEPPYVCGLVISPRGFAFVNIVDPNTYTYGKDDTLFEQFLTVEEAIARAKELDPYVDTSLFETGNLWDIVPSSTIKMPQI